MSHHARSRIAHSLVSSLFFALLVACGRSHSQEAPGDGGACVEAACTARRGVERGELRVRVAGRRAARRHRRLRADHITPKGRRKPSWTAYAASVPNDDGSLDAAFPDAPVLRGRPLLPRLAVLLPGRPLLRGRLPGGLPLLLPRRPLLPRLAVLLPGRGRRLFQLLRLPLPAGPRLHVRPCGPDACGQGYESTPACQCVALPPTRALRGRRPPLAVEAATLALTSAPRASSSSTGATALRRGPPTPAPRRTRGRSSARSAATTAPAPPANGASSASAPTAPFSTAATATPTAARPAI